jgi:hypothetical protein
MRIFAISDIHVDFAENRQWINLLSPTAYQQDALILAGDVCHGFDLLRVTLLNLRSKFSKLFFVPGNHDLWINGEDWNHSVEKFERIFDFCLKNDISVKAKMAGKVWIVPLLSWYTRPEEGDDSLYWPKSGEDPSNRMWSDNYYVKWPDSEAGFHASSHFYERNAKRLPLKFTGPVISMSHFVPRKEMMFGRYPPIIDPNIIKKYDRSPEFNFSRVAGSTLIEMQIRRIKSLIHVYGHQHINRDRVIDGVRYIAHCLGYPNERKRGVVTGVDQGLKLVWDADRTA